MKKHLNICGWFLTFKFKGPYKLKPWKHREYTFHLLPYICHTNASCMLRSWSMGWLFWSFNIYAE